MLFESLYLKAAELWKMRILFKNERNVGCNVQVVVHFDADKCICESFVTFGRPKKTRMLQAQDPRKRFYNNAIRLHEGRNVENIACSVRTCYKRSAGQEEFGPFWANRGKKDPTYLRDKLFAQEPSWILRNNIADKNEPFFITRGKRSGNDDWKTGAKGDYDVKNRSDEDNEYDSETSLDGETSGMMRHGKNF